MVRLDALLISHCPRLAAHFYSHLQMAAWKIAPALACGNTVILKAAEQTPLSVLYLAKLVQEAGFPPGVLNIVNGYGRTAGAALAAHLGVDKIAFTGSTVTAKAIMRAAANNLKNITLETGGKSPLMVFEDANLDQAIKWSHVGIMTNMGQICTSTSRIYVQESIYQKFLAKFKEWTLKTSVVGNQFDPDVNHGPQISKMQQEKILHYVEAAQADGAKLILGGVRGKGSGYFIEPTIFADATNDMRAVREEIFGPFVMIQPFKTEEEVIEKANDTEYGLSAAVFTQDSVRAHRVASLIHAGTVWVSKHYLFESTTRGLVEERGKNANKSSTTAQQFSRFAYRNSIWWVQAKWYWSRVGRIRSGCLYSG